MVLQDNKKRAENLSFPALFCLYSERTFSVPSVFRGPFLLHLVMNRMVMPSVAFVMRLSAYCAVAKRG
jgi:hypothetical protein